MKTLVKILPGIIALSALTGSCTHGNARSAGPGSDTAKTAPKAAATASASSQPPAITVNPANIQDVIIAKIKGYQKQYVKDSWGIEANQCFTQADLDAFETNGITRQVVNDFKTGPDYAGIEAVLNKKSAAERQAILQNARDSYRKPWKVLGLDPQTAPKAELEKGQSDAGSQAEREIADAVAGAL